MQFGDVLKGLLEDADISQKQLARDLNLAPTTLNNYVHCQREPDFETLKKFADYFHVTADYLLGRDSQPVAAQRDEQRLLYIYRSLKPEQQRLLCEIGVLLSRHK